MCEVSFLISLRYLTVCSKLFFRIRIFCYPGNCVIKSFSPPSVLILDRYATANFKTCFTLIGSCFDESRYVSIRFLKDVLTRLTSSSCFTRCWLGARDTEDDQPIDLSVPPNRNTHTTGMWLILKVLKIIELDIKKSLNVNLPAKV